MDGIMVSNRIRTVGDYIESLRGCDRIIIQVNRPGLPIPPGRFFSFNPKNLNDSERMILEAIQNVEVEALRFQDPILNI